MFIKKSIVSVLCCLVVSCSTCYGKKFDEKVLLTIVQNSLDEPEENRLTFILKELNATYNTPDQPHFYLFNGGNAHGLIGLLYASLTEYVIIYGTPLHNGGHSGRYLMTVRDFIYRGKVCIAAPCNIEGREVFPGELTVLPWGSAHHYAMEANTWMIEYGYGFTPSALPFMLLGTVATGDIIGAASLMWGYTKQIVRNLLPF